MKTQTLRNCGVFTAALFILAAATVQSPAQAVSNFVDEFTTFDTNTWRLVNPASGASFDGIVGDGYQVTFPANGIVDSGLEISLDGGTNNPGDSVTNSFTIDVTVQFSNVGPGFTGHSKFRFFGGQFIEFFHDIDADTIRVFSAEAGGNIGGPVTVGLAAGGNVLNLRLSRDVTSGEVVAAFSVGTNALQLLGSVSGLQNFTPNECDIVMARDNAFIGTPTLVIDRYEQQEGVIGIVFDAFTDPFDGPTLDPSWDVVGAEHVGFIGGGLYEVKKTNTVGEAGLSRDFGGESTFNSSIRFQMQDFNGSESQVEFRNPAPSGGITVTLNSANDIVVEAEGSTVEELTNFGYQDGETLEFQISMDLVASNAQVGLRRNGGQLLRIADLTGLSDFPTNNELVVIKNAAGNGNSPRLLFDEYSLAEGFVTIPAAAFTDDFTGPTLDSGWFTSDTGVGSQIGFNGAGQYEISPQGAGVTAGLRRFLGIAGDATIDLRACLNDFAGSDSEMRLEIPGAGGMSVIIKSDGTLDVFTAETSTTVLSTPHGISDGDLFDLRLTVGLASFGTNGVYEVGLGINGAELTFLVDDFDLTSLDTVQAQVLITKNGVGNGNDPVLVLDRFKVSEGFNLIPEVLVPFSDDFSSDPGGWTPVGLTHIGYTTVGTNDVYVVEVTTNAQVYLSRDIATDVLTPIPVGSFNMRADIQFTDWAGTNAPGGGADFKFWIQSADGGRLMEIVFNSFKTVRFAASGNGGTFLNDTLTEFQDGDTVNFGVIYDALASSVTMSVGLNGGPAIFKETRSDLVGVGPLTIRFQGFRFNFVNLDLTPTFALDQLDILTGLAGVSPGPLSIEEAYGGRIQLEWGLGTLQSAPTVDGTYTPVGLKATSPYLQFPTAGQEYFRTEN